MGLTPFSCVTAQDCVRIVYPDGHVVNRSRPCRVKELLLGNSDYYVCGSTPHTITNRMAEHEMLEYGFTYFVSSAPDARPFQERRSKKLHRSKIFSRLSRHGVQGQESRNSSLGNQQSRKVFDYDSATIQRLVTMRSEGAGQNVNEGGSPKHLKLVFIRHCLHQLRHPRNSYGQARISRGHVPEEVSPPPSEINDDIMQIILKSSARSELGIYVSRRQEFYMRRARRRRKIAWKPVLQSISEMKPVVEFHAPEQQQEIESPSKNSPPAPSKNISPPRRQVSGMSRSSPSANNVSPPLQSHFFVPPAAPAAPKYSTASQQVRRTRSNGRSLYMA